MKELVSELAARLLESQLHLATAESCTGGWIGRELTAIPGSSAWYEGGVISYSNKVKCQLLQVPATLLEKYGAVSEPVALAMAKGVRLALGTDISVAITGIAGPDGGSADKPVGTIWIAWSLNQHTFASDFVFSGDREQVRECSVQEALLGLLKMLE